jgi:hypothetical protein
MRSVDPANLPEPARRLLQSSRRFAAGLLPGPEFETAFLAARMDIHAVLPETLADVIDQMFYGVDDYVADDELRPNVYGGIDEEQLREVVRAQLRRLDGA